MLCGHLVFNISVLCDLLVTVYNVLFDMFCTDIGAAL